MKNHTFLVLMGGFLLAGGCSSLVAMSGTDTSALASMEQVHKEYGKPIVTGVANGQDYEEFKTHSKVAEPERAGILVMGDLMTCGLMELFLFPYELATVGHTAVVGDTVRFCHDQQGNVTEVYLDGDQVSLRTNAGKTIEGKK